MVTSKNWFEVDTAGLRQLQLNKPKWFAVREILANAFDEHTKKVLVYATFNKGAASIKVVDDSPFGFKDLRDAFTLFKECAKRPDPTKRGRFNVGEKQAFAICESASIATTKGVIQFNRRGRTILKKIRESGSEVQMDIKMKRPELEDIVRSLACVIPPEGVTFVVNGIETKVPAAVRDVPVVLNTEFSKDGEMRRAIRGCRVFLYKSEEFPYKQAWLYELGIPVQPIDCKWSLDVRQRIPMGFDRDVVSETYLKHLFAQVLNQTTDIIAPEDTSRVWVRQGASDSMIAAEVVKDISTKRYGDKVCTYTPADPVANDDALASGYRLLHSNDMSPEEWEQVRKANAIQSSHELFGHGLADSETIEPDADMAWSAMFAKKVMERFYNIKIAVRFVKSDATARATYGGRSLTFNVSRTGRAMFGKDGLPQFLPLLLHELGHHRGNHTEIAYHEMICDLGARLTVTALIDKHFFD